VNSGKEAAVICSEVGVFVVTETAEESGNRRSISWRIANKPAEDSGDDHMRNSSNFSRAAEMIGRSDE
jgi:hypothetical protein